MLNVTINMIVVQINRNIASICYSFISRHMKKNTNIALRILKLKMKRRINFMNETVTIN